MTQIYPDNVNSSMKALKTVLSRALRDKFKSGLDKKQGADVVEEIVNTLCGELEKFFIESSNVQIDQVSGRIESKLDSLGIKCFTFSDELLNALSEKSKSSGFSDAIKALASVNVDGKIAELQDLFDTAGEDESSEQEEIKQTDTGPAEEAGELFADGKEKKKKKKKSTIEKVAQYLDDTFKDVLFFENVISRIDYTIRTALEPVYNLNQQLLWQQQALAKENMKLAGEYAKLTTSVMGLAASAEALAASNMTLASSRLGLASSTFMLAVSTLADAAAILIDAVVNTVLAAVNIVFAIVYFVILTAFALTVVLVTAAIIAALAIATIAIIAALAIATIIIIAAIAVLAVAFVVAVALAAIALAVFVALLAAALVVAAAVAIVVIVAVAAVAALIIVAAAVVMAAAIAALAIILAAAILVFAAGVAAIGYGVIVSMEVIAGTTLGVMVSMMAASVTFLGGMALAFAAYMSTMFLTTIAYGAAGITAAIGTVAALVATVSLTILLIALLLAFALRRLLKNVHEAFAKWWEESPLRGLIEKVKEWWYSSSIRKWLHDKIEALKSKPADNTPKQGLSDALHEFLANNRYVQLLKELFEAMKTGESFWKFLNEKFPFKEWIDNGLQFLYDTYMPETLKSVIEWWKNTKQKVEQAFDKIAEEWGIFTDWCVSVGNDIIKGISDAYNAVVDWASDIIESAGQMLEKAWKYCEAAVKMIWDTVMAYVVNIGEKTGSYVMSGLNRTGKFFAKISKLNPWLSKEEYEKNQADWDKANAEREKDRAEMDAKLQKTLDEINARWKEDQEMIKAWSNEIDRDKKEKAEKMKLAKEQQEKSVKDTKANLKNMLDNYKKGQMPEKSATAALAGSTVGSVFGSSSGLASPGASKPASVFETKSAPKAAEIYKFDSKGGFSGWNIPGLDPWNN